MGQRIKNLNEIKDSRLLYEKKIPAFGYMIIVVLVLFMTILTVWAYKTPKISVVKASGYVQSAEKNYVMASYSGEILSSNYEEGMVVKEGDVLCTVKSVDLDLQLEQLEEQKLILNKEIEKYNRLIKALDKDNNEFSLNKDDEKELYNKYELYKNKKEQLVVDEAALRAYGCTEEDIKAEKDKKESQKKQLYYDEVASINELIANYAKEINTIDIQIKSIMNGKLEYEVKAPISGQVHVVQEYKEGMVIQAGTTIASIATNNDELEIIATVSEADATKIKEKDDVEIQISGLTQSVYGTISGKIISKDTDVTMDNTQQGKVSYFKVVIKPDYNYVISKSGDKVSLSNGMGIEARVKYDKVTYLAYVLDIFGIEMKM